MLLAVENTGTLSQANKDSPQLGLKNIRERLRLLYGDRARLRLEEHEGRVKATVAIELRGRAHESSPC